jgi:hypothetical protein
MLYSIAQSKQVLNAEGFATRARTRAVNEQPLGRSRAMSAVFSRKVAVVLAALLSLGTRAAFAQRGSVSGTVKEQADNAPVAGAVVQLSGTNRRGISNRDGRYVITQVDVGTYRIRVSAIGYATTASTVTVAEGAPATVDFALLRSVMTLEQISVTPAGEQTQRESGAPATIVNNIDSITRNQTVTNFGDLLSGVSPG